MGPGLISESGVVPLDSTILSTTQAFQRQNLHEAQSSLPSVTTSYPFNPPQPSPPLSNNTLTDTPPAVHSDLPQIVDSALQSQAAGGDVDDRRRPEEIDSGRLVQMATALAPSSVSPFLQEHIPAFYAPVGKPDFKPAPHTHVSNGSSSNKDQQGGNSKYCYRHAPDSKCRRAADESKMAMIQNELDLLPSNDRQAITHVWSLFSAAPAKHRELMLQGIITQCCFPQLSTVSREVQEQLKIDFISALPTEISIKILCYLDTSSLCKAAQVNHKWRMLADDNQVWHRMCSQHIDRKCTKCGWGLPLLERKRLRQWATKPRDIFEVDHDEPVAETQTPDSNKRKRGNETQAVSQKKTRAEKERLLWKQVYRERFEVGSNWKYGRCNIKVLRGHQNGITCLGFDDNILVSGSYDGTIHIWDIHTGELMRILKGHTGGVRTLHFAYPVLITGSLDRTVRVWNINSNPGTEEINNIQAHTDGVISVHSSTELIVSGGIDKTIQVFELKTRNKYALRGHMDWVNQVRIDDQSRTIFSASDDLTVKMWDIDNRECLRTFEGHVGQVQQVLLMPEDFEPDEFANLDTFSVTSDARGTTPTRSTGGVSENSVRATIHPDAPFVSIHPTPPPPELRGQFGECFERDPSRPLPPAYMLTAGLDNTVRLWCVATGKCLRTMFGHVEGIWGLAGDTLRVVTGANDFLVKVWEPRSGKCERTFAGHEGPVTCVGLSDSRMASGSEDGTIRLYTFEGSSLAQCGTPC